MKNVLLILLLVLISLNCYSQDTIKIPQQELNDFFLALDTLEYQDSLNIILLKSLELQVSNYKLLSQQDSLLLSFKNQEIILLNNQITLHLDRLNSVDRWYYKPWVGFIGGAAMTILMIHTIDYTLPK